MAKIKALILANGADDGIVIPVKYIESFSFHDVEAGQSLGIITTSGTQMMFPLPDTFLGFDENGDRIVLFAGNDLTTSLAEFIGFLD